LPPHAPTTASHRHCRQANVAVCRCHLHCRRPTPPSPGQASTTVGTLPPQATTTSPPVEQNRESEGDARERVRVRERERIPLDLVTREEEASKQWVAVTDHGQREGCQPPDLGAGVVGGGRFPWRKGGVLVVISWRERTWERGLAAAFR
jgi:hypothetical protein